MSELYIKMGDAYRPAVAPEICAAASRCVMDKANADRPHLNSPRAATDFIKYQGGLDYEQFGAIFLDNRCRMIEVTTLFTGTINASSVHPREVVKHALRCEANKVIFFHNHPSGDMQASKPDVAITKALKAALDLIDVTVLDHLIVGGNGAYSMAEVGLL